MLMERANSFHLFASMRSFQLEMIKTGIAHLGECLSRALDTSAKPLLLLVEIELYMCTQYYEQVQEHRSFLT